MQSQSTAYKALYTFKNVENEQFTTYKWSLLLTYNNLHTHYANNNWYVDYRQSHSLFLQTNTIILTRFDHKI